MSSLTRAVEAAGRYPKSSEWKAALFGISGPLHWGDFKPCLSCQCRWLQGEGQVAEDVAAFKSSCNSVGNGLPEVELSSSPSSPATPSRRRRGAGRFLESCRFGAAETSGTLSRSSLRVRVPRLSANDSSHNRLKPSNGCSTPGLVRSWRSPDNEHLKELWRHLSKPSLEFCRCD